MFMVFYTRIQQTIQKPAGIPAPFPAPVEVDSEVTIAASADTPLVAGATAFNFL
jgi:hypothetical protein